MTDVNRLPEDHPWQTPGVSSEFLDRARLRIGELQERYSAIMEDWDDMIAWTDEQVEALVEGHLDVEHRAVVLHTLATLLVDGTEDIEDQRAVEQISADASRVIDRLEDSTCLISQTGY